MLQLTNLLNIVNVSKSKNSEVLTKVRLWMYVLSFLHLSAVALKIFLIDFRMSPDPKVWVYQDIRFKLITCWFNLLSLAYFPLSIYCEWRELTAQGGLQHVRILNQIRYICFTSILLPTTAFSDILFWRLWNKDRELIAPATVDELAPFWTQHCMHTVSLVVVVMDLILCPRKRPENPTLGFSVMCLYVGAYTCVCAHAIIIHGQYFYPVLKSFSLPKLCILALYVFLEHYFYYTLQWFVIDFIWGCREARYNQKSSEFLTYSKLKSSAASAFSELDFKKFYLFLGEHNLR